MFNQKWAKSCVIYLAKTIKFWLHVTSSLMRGSRQKSVRANAKHLAHIIPDFIQIGLLSAELQLTAWRPFFWPIG